MLNGDRIGADWWHEVTDRRPLSAVLVTGVAATIAAVVVGYMLPGIGLPTVAWPLSDGELVAPYSEFGTAGQVTVGFGFTLLAGTLGAFLYGVFVQPAVATRGAVAQVVVGLVIGVLLAFVLLAFFLPLVYAPERGYGRFMAAGPDGWALPLSVTITTLVYGGSIGLLFQPRPPVRGGAEES